MKGSVTYRIEEGEYAQIKVASTGSDRFCLTFKVGRHLMGMAFTEADSVIDFSMPADFAEELADHLRTIANQVEAIGP